MPVKTWLGHPAGLVTLFFTETWERFSYYGMRAILSLFLASNVDGGLGMKTAVATAVYGAYGAMVYLMSLPGGWVADRITGTRRAILYGGIIIALGHYVLAVPVKATFWLGLILIVLGTGLLKPNISTMVGELYDKYGQRFADRRDSGFTLFYMGINLGAFGAPLIVSWLADRKGWHWGFAVAALGMTLAVIQFVLGRKRLAGVGEQAHRPLDPAEKKQVTRYVLLGLLGFAAVFGLLALIGQLKISSILNVLTLLAIAVAVAYFWRILSDRNLSREERSRMVAFVAIFVGAAIFWMIYEQSGSTLTFFVEEKVNRRLFGTEIAAGSFNSVQPGLVLLLAPLFAALWLRLGARQPSTPIKFALALVGVGLSFVIMAFAGRAATGGLISPLWLVGVYLVQVVAELLLSPVGLSVTTKLAPARYASQAMGLWFLATSVGSGLNTWVTPLDDKMSDVTYYGLIGAVAVAVGIVLWLLARKIRALMGGVH